MIWIFLTLLLFCIWFRQKYKYYSVYLIKLVQTCTGLPKMVQTCQDLSIHPILFSFYLLVPEPQDLLVLKNETSFIHSFKETLWFQAAVTSRRMERSTFVDVKSARPTVFLASWRPGRRKWVYRVHR